MGEMTPARIWQMESLTHHQKRLAVIWRQLEEQLGDGFEQLGLDHLFGEYVPLDEMRDFGEQINQVLDQRRNKRYQGIGGIKGHGVVVSGTRYENIVSFSRGISWRHAVMVSEVMKAAENEAIARIVEISRTYDEDRGRKLMEDFFREFPCGVSIGDSYETKLKTMRVLVAKYKS